MTPTPPADDDRVGTPEPPDRDDQDQIARWIGEGGALGPDD